jgi:hypothetical protein
MRQLSAAAARDLWNRSRRPLALPDQEMPKTNVRILTDATSVGSRHVELSLPHAQCLRVRLERRQLDRQRNIIQQADGRIVVARHVVLPAHFGVEAAASGLEVVQPGVNHPVALPVVMVEQLVSSATSDQCPFSHFILLMVKLWDRLTPCWLPKSVASAANWAFAQLIDQLCHFGELFVTHQF